MLLNVKCPFLPNPNFCRRDIIVSIPTPYLLLTQHYLSAGIGIDTHSMMMGFPF